MIEVLVPKPAFTAMNLFVGMPPLLDKDGARWIFVGYEGPTSTGSRQVVFMREMQPNERLSPSNPWCYHCTYIGPLITKFPGIVEYLV